MRVVKVLSLLLGVMFLLAAAALVVLGVLGIGVGGGGGKGGATTIATAVPTDGAGKLNTTLYCKDHVMTVAYKAYGNAEAADGKYWLGKLVLDNPGQGPLNNVRISYRIPDWLNEWSTAETTPMIWPGQTYVLPIYPKFPARVAELRSSTTATLEVKIQYATQGKEAEPIVERRDFQLSGRNEIWYTSLPKSEVVTWYDMFDNHELLAAYVSGEDDAVKTFLGLVGEFHLGVSTADNAEKIAQMLAKIYEFQRKTGMSYVAAKGFPEKAGDVESVKQNVRLPRDVIESNGGLCIDLALLMCSLCDRAGAQSKLVLVPGHAYVLIRAATGSELAFECTGLNEGRFGSSLTWAQALKKGMEEIEEVRQGRTDGIIIDIRECQGRGIVPPELPPIDTAKLTGLLKDRLANPGVARLPGADLTPAVNPGAAPVKPVPVNVTVPFPATWVTDAPALKAFMRAVPECKLFAADPSGDKYVQWFYYAGNDLQAFQKSTRDWAKKGLTYTFDRGTSLAKVGNLGATRQTFTISGGDGGDFKGELFTVETKAGPVFIVYACSESSDIKSVINETLPKVDIR